MKVKIIEYFDFQFIKFLFVGVINTVVGLILMFFFYNVLKMGYWGSSSTSYILASILSFFLNKNFTFRNKNSIFDSAFKFSLTIIICYFIAYSISRPIIYWFIRITNIYLLINYIEQIAMIMGMIIFTLLNYFGQRFYAFNSRSN